MEVSDFATHFIEQRMWGEGVRGSVVVKAHATSRKVSGLSPDGVNEFF
jgi:hypothetical protein